MMNKGFRERMFEMPRDIKIDIISGFLGAGKTTLIKEMIKWHSGEKLAIVENEFGEVSIDGPVLKSHGIEVKEISSGCICCSVSGDFKKAIEEIADSHSPERIIIEPTGIGKLSQIKENLELSGFSRMKFITVVDAENYSLYLENFGEFYKDQVEYADIVFVSRTEDKGESEIQDIEDSVREINPEAVIISDPLSELKAEQFELRGEDGDSSDESEKIQGEESEVCIVCGESHDEGECGHSHGHEHSHEHGHVHNHEDTADFETHSVRTDKYYSLSDIEEMMNEFDRINEDDTEQQILRAKGIIAGRDSDLHFEYLPNTRRIETADSEERGIAAVIGVKLDRDRIDRLFKLK